MRRRRGYTLIEMLVGFVVGGVVSGALLTGFLVMLKAQAASTNMPVNQENAHQIVTTLASGFRAASDCTSSDSGCTVGAAVENATSTGCTIYERGASGALVKMTYSVSNGKFQVSTNGGTPTTLYTGASLTLTYYQSSAMYATSMSTYTPTSSTTNNLIAVKIVGAVYNAATASSTYTEGNTYSTLVRLRNSY